ncbi:hypothetical protein Salat_0932400 [Sesamum alatum]|uniref:Uncharacterized protein n=1 Tax=Sesamum alatum TaxID=300844 RepID=A0AAE2CRE1_9LAMI|nr:hypothetical protein Salat_0932400 [Sesamum alatum]
MINGKDLLEDGELNGVGGDRRGIMTAPKKGKKSCGFGADRTNGAKKGDVRESRSQEAEWMSMASVVASVLSLRHAQRYCAYRGEARPAVVRVAGEALENFSYGGRRRRVSWQG